MEFLTLADQLQAVTKDNGPGISPTKYEMRMTPTYSLKGNQRKIQPKEHPSCLICLPTNGPYI